MKRKIFSIEDIRNYIDQLIQLKKENKYLPSPFLIKEYLDALEFIDINESDKIDLEDQLMDFYIEAYEQ